MGWQDPLQCSGYADAHGGIDRLIPVVLIRCPSLQSLYAHLSIKSSLLGSFLGFFALRILHHLNYILSCASCVSKPLIKRIDTLYHASIDKPPLEAIKKNGFMSRGY